MQLTSDIASLSGEIESLLANLRHPTCSTRMVGEFCEELSQLYRTIAIARLLIEADVDAWHHGLLRSAYTRIYFLEFCQAQSATDFTLAASRSEPLFDALAAGDFDVAATIARLSPPKWMSRDEYEDDFLYAHFLHGLLLNRDDKDARQDIIDRFDSVLEGKSSPRLDMCRALAVADQSAFDQSFAMLLDDKLAQNRRERELFIDDQVSVIANQRVFVEGLGLQGLAERVGLKVAAEYLLCPELARFPMTTPFPGDGFPIYEGDGPGM